MSNGQEKRKYKRIEKPYIARLRIKQYEGLEISSAEWDIVALKDLSAGGALFYYSKYLGHGSLLDLKIVINTRRYGLRILTKLKKLATASPTNSYI